MFFNETTERLDHNYVYALVSNTTALLKEAHAGKCSCFNSESFKLALKNLSHIATAIECAYNYPYP